MAHRPHRRDGRKGGVEAEALARRIERRALRTSSAIEVDPTKAAHLLVDCKYMNDLPKVPVPKLLKAVPNLDKLAQYTPTVLELDHRPLLISEKDLLSCIEMVDPDAYGELPGEGSMMPPAPPLDAQILRDDDIGQEIKESELKRRRMQEETEASHREAFGLQLPQLITNDVFTERQRYITGLSAAEKKLTRNAPGFKTSEDVAERVENTFEAAKKAPEHPTNPGLKPKRVMPIVPDAVLWANRYQQVVFDELPQEPKPNDLLFKTVPNPRVTCFGYFSPAAEPETFNLMQSYFWDNRGGFTRQLASGEAEAMLLSFPPASEENGDVRFVPVPSQMRLKKQKAHSLELSVEAKVLSVKHRDPSAQEQAEERERMSMVLNEASGEVVSSLADSAD